MNPRASRLIVCLILACGIARAAAAAEPTPTAIATYECLGLYWSAPEARECAVQFRREGDAAWHAALPLVYDARDHEWRGSIVGLVPNASYEIKLRAGESEVTLKARTRSDQFPVGETTTLPAGDSADGVTINKSGTPQGYHLVTAPSDGRSTIDVRNRGSNLIIDADYVIVRGLELRNAATHGILIKAGHHDIVVEQCHIFGWGRFAGSVSFGNVGGDLDSAIYAEKGCGTLTLQRNLLENPRGASSDWEFGHPVGPQGISLINSTGGNVVRYNEIVSTDDHGFNDGFGGGDNFSRAGSPNRDSDIYGNLTPHCRFIIVE